MYTRNLRRAVIGIIGGMGLLVVSLLSTAVSIASAHSYPVRSLPAADSVLSASPKTVSIWFSELPQSGFSEIDVFDQTLKQVDLKNSTVSADQLSVGVPDTLSTGTYTVRWSAVSAVDGHHTTGAFVFAVGEAISGNAAAAAQAAQTASSANPVDAIVKWLDILSLTALCGAVLITLGVLRPMFGVRGLPDQLSSAIGWLLYAALIASVFGAVAGLFAKMISLYGADLLAFAGLKRWIELLTQTRYGAMLIVRLGLTIAMAIWLAGWRVKNTARTWLSGLLITLGLLLTISLNSHSAANPLWPGLTLFMDWLHLIGVSAWIGGLLVMAVLLPRLNPGQRRDALIRFSAVATLSVAVLTLTGLYSAAVQLNRFEDLWESEYGRWLLIKLAIIGVLLILGALNNLVLNPKRLKQIKVLPLAIRRTLANENAAGQVQRRILIESLLGIGVLLTVGFLTASSPPPPQPITVDRTLTQTRVEGDLTAALHITPNVSGPNTYSVQVKRADQPLTTLSQVRAQFVLPTLDLHTVWITFKPDANGIYTASGRELSILGDWQVLLDVQVDAESNAVRFAYPWTVSAATLGQDLSQPRPINLLMIGLLSVTVALIGWPRILAVLRGKYGKAPEYAVIGLIAVALISSMALMLASAYSQNAFVAGLPTTNPIVADTASLIKGQTTYKQICERCHGAQGLGDGVAAASLAVQPANLRTHVAQHGDAVLYQMIAQGYGAMPAMGAGLSPDERWNLVNYLRTLGTDTVSLK